MTIEATTAKLSDQELRAIEADMTGPHCPRLVAHAKALAEELAAANAENARLTADYERLAEQLIAVLRLDLGYSEQPTYGHAPLRHQIAWTWAAEAIGSDKLNAHLESCANTERDEGSKPLTAELADVRKQLADSRASVGSLRHELGHVPGENTKDRNKRLRVRVAELQRKLDGANKRLAELTQPADEDELGRIIWETFCRAMNDGHLASKWDEVKETLQDAYRKMAEAFAARVLPIARSPLAQKIAELTKKLEAAQFENITLHARFGGKMPVLTCFHCSAPIGIVGHVTREQAIAHLHECHKAPLKELKAELDRLATDAGANLLAEVERLRKFERAVRDFDESEEDDSPMPRAIGKALEELDQAAQQVEAK